MKKRTATRLITWFACCLAAIAPVGAVAQDADLPSVEDIIAQAKAKDADSRDYSADLQMLVSMQGMKLEYAGTIKAKGERFRIDMSVPMMGQVINTTSIMAEGGTMYTETTGAGMNQVMKYDRDRIESLMKEIYGEEFIGNMGGMGQNNNDPRQLLDNIKHQFDLEVTGKETLDGVDVYVLRGKMKQDLANKMDPTQQLSGMGFDLNNVEYMIGVEDGFPRAFGYPMQDGGYSMRMLYSNLNFEPELEDALFEYTPPEGVEVTDMTDMIEQQLKALQSGELGAAMNQQAPPNRTAATVGEPALAFEGTTYGGETLTLEDYKGKVVLLDFWATWCGPCVAEMPNVIAAYEKFHDQGLEIVGISLDDSEEALAGFLEERPKMTWSHIYDGRGWDSAVANLYEVQSIPTTVLIDREGVVRHVNLRGAQLEAAIEDLL